MVGVWFFLVFWLGLAVSAQADDIPDPRIWAAKLSDQRWLETPGLVRTLSLDVEEAKRSAWQPIIEDFATIGFFKILDVRALPFFVSLNQGLKGERVNSKFLYEVLPAQLVLRDEGRQILVQRLQNSELKPVARWSIGAKDRQSSIAFHAWLNAKLAYDAVVLDQQDEFILAGLVTSRQELGQGLLLKNSAARWFLKPEKRRGQALLQMLKVDGELAVFEILLSQGDALAVPGTKILLGQGRKLQQMLQAPASSQPVSPQQ